MAAARVSHGRAIRALHVGPFTLTEAVYAPHQEVARHEHGWSSWTVVLQGGFEERFTRETVRAMHGTVLSKPATADHANVYGPAGARCLLIETQDGEHCFDGPRIHELGIVAKLGGRIHEEARSTDPLARFSLEALLIELGAATRRSRDFVPVRGRQAWLNDVREQLEAQFRAPPALAELAHRRGVHPAYLCQAFRAAFGLSVGQFVRVVRFEWSRDALRYGAPIADVAAAAGFSDQAHFTRDFRRRTGTSPGHFRSSF